MNTYLDNILGELSFDYGWIKPINIQLAHQAYTIPCVFSASKKDMVNEAQKNAYILFQAKQPHFEERMQQLLKNYITENKIQSPQYQPIKFLFQRDGSFGLLLDCNWDVEHGIAIVLSPYEEVGMQDIFL